MSNAMCEHGVIVFGTDARICDECQKKQLPIFSEVISSDRLIGKLQIEASIRDVLQRNVK